MSDVPDLPPDGGAAALLRGVRLHETFVSDGDPAALDQAVRELRCARALLSDDQVLGPAAAGELGRVLRRLSGRSDGGPRLLDEAVDLLRIAVRDTPAGEFALVHRHNLAAALGDRHEATNRPADLTEAEEVCREALRIAGPDGPHRGALTALLANTLRAQYQNGWGGDRLTDALDLALSAYRGADPGDPAYGAVAHQAAVVLLEQQSRTGGKALLDQALEAVDAALAHAAGVEERALYLPQRGKILHQTARTTGRAADFEAGDLAFGQALDLLPAGHRDRAGLLQSRGSLRRDHHAHHADPHLLAASEEDLRAAVGAMTPDDIDYGVVHNGLGMTLLARHRFTGDLGCLDQAIGCFRRAEETAVEGDPFRQVVLTHLGSALIDRYRTTRKRVDTKPARADLEEALEASEAALAAATGADASLSLLMGNLAVARTALYEVTGDTALLRAAEADHRRVLATYELDDFDRDRTLMNLGRVLVQRVEADDAGEGALAEGERLLREVHARWPRRHAAFPTVVGNLADCLRVRDARRPDPAARRDRATVLRDLATTNEPLPAAARASTCVAWAAAEAADGDWARATDAYDRALTALEEAAAPVLDRRSRESAAAAFFGAASDAAGCALNAERPDRALEFLERGRLLLADRSRDHTTVFDDLARHLPRAAERFRWLSGRLYDADAASVPYAQRGEWERERTELLATIRQLPGFTHFLRGPSHRDLLAGLGDRTVVVLNAGRYRCDAILVTREGTRVLPLPAVTKDVLVRQAARLLSALRTLADHQAPDDERYFAEHTTLPATLRWLWHSTMSPVLHGLGLAGPHPPGRPLPHVRWCPTGLLGFFPLHAAGTHPFDRGAGGPGPVECVLDHVVSSYTPGIAAAEARDAAPAAADGPARLLAVAPATPGVEPLPHAAAEVAAVRGVRPHGTDLTGPAATRSRILRELPEHSWFHFAGHARQDVLSDDGDATGLLPYDLLPAHRLLTPADLAALPPGRRELAFLSACQTATGRLDLADEAAHLAGAFLAAGFRQVVATQWPVRDGTAARVAAHFYRGATDPGRAAGALHTAVCAARASGLSPYVWAPFVHWGG
ncbi:CHAT domain-containing protein [Streptomyces sp. NPDC090306]|uniref:CHAT domain-containing protein n=1 Tax=Streptomyces sp. NPDC090306 TaxID=3365961 RepID=UPI0037F4209D